VSAFSESVGSLFAKNVRRVPASLLLLLIAATGCRKTAVAEEDAAAPLAVETQTVRLETLRATVSGPGVVTPAAMADWTIYPQETGRVAELPKAEGEAVKPGDLLVRFDFANLGAELSARESEITTATARVDAAKAQLSKVSAMYDRGYSARIELDSARNAVASAELDLTRAKAQLAAAEGAAERATVRARFPGVVAKRFHNEGDLVNGAVTDPVLRVVDPTQVQVSMTVPVQDLARIQAGQLATIVSANGAEPARVTSRPSPDDPRATTQEIRLAFANPATLPIDAPVQVEILLAERPNVTAIPASAVLRADDGRPFVMVAGVDGRAHRRDVHLGLAARDRVEIIAGVTPGDRVIVKNVSQVPEGALLNIER
jgi:RND family efflux transporter MFP subunit